jgi:hypothetical protein
MFLLDMKVFGGKKSRKSKLVSGEAPDQLMWNDPLALHASSMGFWYYQGSLG